MRFSERIIIDIMYFDGDSVPHIVDEGTHLSVAVLFLEISFKTTLQTILNLWSAICTALPQRILMKQGHFISKGFVELSGIGGVKVQQTGIKTHSSLSLR